MARNKFDIDEELLEKFDAKQLKRLFGYLKPYMGKVFVAVLLMLTASLLALLDPYIIKVALDTVIPNGDVPGLVLLALAYLGILAVNAVCMKYRIRIMSQIGQNIIYNIR